MSENHEHAGHDHSHSHAPPSNNAAFAIGVILNLGFVVAEVVYGAEKPPREVADGA